MTKEEHIARAMLMGKVYDPRDHTYSIPNFDTVPTFNGIIDADTLGPLDMKEAMDRFGARKEDTP